MPGQFDAIVNLTNKMYDQKKPFKDQLFVRFMPAMCTCMIWLYVVVYNHPACERAPDCKLA